MASIYHNAQFTIIAAEKGVALLNLPGIAPRDSWRQLESCKFLQKAELDVGYRQEPATDNTMWATRGWTYQEELFSRRCFIFRSNSVIFRCDEMMWDEGIRRSSPRQEIHDGLNTELVVMKWPSVRYFQNLLEKFLVRELSFPCDSLDAFAGILHVLEGSFPGGFHYGLPELFFDITLLWQPRGTLEDVKILAQAEGKPSTQLPSWSWSRWKGLVNFSMWGAAEDPFIRSMYTQNFLVIQGLVDWRKIDRTSRTMISMERESDKYRHCAWSESSTIPLGWQKIKAPPHFSESFFRQFNEPDRKLPTPAMFIHDDIPGQNFRYPLPLVKENQFRWDAIPAVTPHIYGRAQRAFLSLRRPEIESDTANGNHCYDILAPQSGTTPSKKLRQVGVLLPHIMLPLDLEQPGELIAISIGQYRTGHGLDGEFGVHISTFTEWEKQRTWQNDGIYRFVNVMWIYWKEGTAERKGLGRIDQEMWESIYTEEIEVMLG
jgi:hypothetical protein